MKNPLDSQLKSKNIILNKNMKNEQGIYIHNTREKIVSVTLK